MGLNINDGTVNLNGCGLTTTGKATVGELEINASTPTLTFNRSIADAFLKASIPGTLEFFATAALINVNSSKAIQIKKFNGADVFSIDTNSSLVSVTGDITTTGLGTFGELQVDNININGDTINSGDDALVIRTGEDLFFDVGGTLVDWGNAGLYSISTLGVGTIRMSGSQIGLVTDTNLITLTNNAVEIRGTMSISGVMDTMWISDDTIYSNGGSITFGTNNLDTTGTGTFDTIETKAGLEVNTDHLAHYGIEVKGGYEPAGPPLGGYVNLWSNAAKGGENNEYISMYCNLDGNLVFKWNGEQSTSSDTGGNLWFGSDGSGNFAGGDLTFTGAGELQVNTIFPNSGNTTVFGINSTLQISNKLDMLGNIHLREGSDKLIMSDDDTKFLSYGVGGPFNFNDGLTVSGTIKATNYQSGDGSAGITQTVTSVNTFNITIKDGLITSFTKLS